MHASSICADGGANNKVCFHALTWASFKTRYDTPAELLTEIIATGSAKFPEKFKPGSAGNILHKQGWEQLC